MTAPRLRSGIWVSALIRRCEMEAVPAMVVRKGDVTAGSVFVKVNRLDGTADVYSQARDGDGEQIWMRATGSAPVAEQQADDYLSRQFKFDPDIWVIEIEDKTGRPFLDVAIDGRDGFIA